MPSQSLAPRAADSSISEAEPSTTDVSPDVLRLLSEDLTISRTRVETGRVRVRVQTHRRTKAVEAPIVRHDVVIERVPIGREVDAMPTPRQDGDTMVLPVVEEVLVVERKLILKQEVRIRRVRTSDPHTELIELRHQEASVERLPNQPSANESHEQTSVHTP